MASATPRPRFSIVIPTYRRPEHLTRCLDAIALLDFPRDGFEVVVVSDEQSAGADNIIQRYRTSVSVHGMTQEHGGPARARNTGAESARGEFLLFLDDDCAPAPDWLRQWESHASRHPDCAAGGATRNALDRNLYSSASHELVEFIHGYFNAGTSDRHPFLASNNLCVPANRFRTLGGFSTAFARAGAEDRDFCDRWCAQGWSTCRAGAVVFHAHELTLAGFWRQHRNYGCGAFHLHREREARKQPMRFEPVRFYLDLICCPWRQENVGRALLLSGLICVSQFANAAGFLEEWWRSAAG